MTAIQPISKPRSATPVAPPINSAHFDFYTSNGGRLSQPLYYDCPNELRKTLFSAVRSASERLTFESQPSTVSGITVSSANGSGLSRLEAYIGMNMSVLRSVLFSRGGIPLDLILRLQEVSGVEVITAKDIRAAFDQRKKQTLEYVKTYPYQDAEAIN